MMQGGPAQDEQHEPPAPKGLLLSGLLDETSVLKALKDQYRPEPVLEDSSCRPSSRSASVDSDSSAPMQPRMSFTEPPEEDLAALAAEDSMALPPMDPAATPSTHRYSLHVLLSSEAFLHPAPMLRPRLRPDGRLKASPMRDRALHAPLDLGTPTRAQTMRKSVGDCSATAGFLLRTGLEIPPECDPDIPSRSQSCDDPVSEGAPSRGQSSGDPVSESTASKGQSSADSVSEGTPSRLAVGDLGQGRGVFGRRLSSALRKVGERGGSRLRLEADCVGERRDSAVRVGEGAFVCFCLSATAAIVGVGALLVRRGAR